MSSAPTKDSLTITRTAPIDQQDSRNWKPRQVKSHRALRAVSAKEASGNSLRSVGVVDLIVTAWHGDEGGDRRHRPDPGGMPTAACPRTGADCSASRPLTLEPMQFVDDYYSPIVTAEGCETCHDALATNYHTPDRRPGTSSCGRLCHITKSGGSHLRCSRGRSIPMPTRSTRARHSMSAAIDFYPIRLQALHYNEHIECPVSYARHHKLRVVPRGGRATPCRTRPSRCPVCCRNPANSAAWIERSVRYHLWLPVRLRGPVVHATGDDTNQRGCSR